MQRAVVIGAGQIAKQHLGAIGTTRDAEVVGVADLSPVMAESTAERFGVDRWWTDHRRMLEETAPDVAHITTPAPTHFAIAKDCLDAGAHVLIEKPVTTRLAEFEELVAVAESSGLWVLEDHNYLFNSDIQRLLAMRDDGRLGAVRHVEVQINLPVFDAGSRFSDADAPHPAMREPLGAVSDFLTHLAYLAHAFVGPHDAVSCASRAEASSMPDAISEFKAMIQAEHGTALLGLSTGTEMDTFRVRVEGSRGSAEANLFEVGVVTSAARGGPKPLAPIRNMLGRAGEEFGNARRSLSRKLSGGPGAYEGLWRLVSETYDALNRRDEPPITTTTIREVNALVEAVTTAVENESAPRRKDGSPCEC